MRNARHHHLFVFKMEEYDVASRLQTAHRGANIRAGAAGSRSLLELD